VFLTMAANFNTDAQEEDAADLMFPKGNLL